MMCNAVEPLIGENSHFMSSVSYFRALLNANLDPFHSRSMQAVSIICAAVALPILPRKVYECCNFMMAYNKSL